MKMFRVEIYGNVWVNAKDDMDASNYVRDALDDGFGSLNDLRTIYLDDDVMIDQVEHEEHE